MYAGNQPVLAGFYRYVKDFQGGCAHQVLSLWAKDYRANSFLVLPSYPAKTHGHCLFVTIAKTETLF